MESKLLSLYDIYNTGKDVIEPPQFGYKINRELTLSKKEYLKKEILKNYHI